MAKLPPRLYLRTDWQIWLIRDGSKQISTGFRKDQLKQAENALDAYTRKKGLVDSEVVNPAHVDVCEALNAYYEDKKDELKDAPRVASAIRALKPFWAGRNFAEVRGSVCREYDRSRSVGSGTVRRELGTLGAAINHFHKESGPLSAVPKVTLPPAPPPKETFLTRSEAARFLAAALGFYKENGKLKRDFRKCDRHLARFFLIGLYTGTRHQAILNMRWNENKFGGHYDSVNKNLYRKSSAERESKKRQPPVRVGPKLAGHLRRWKRIDMKVSRSNLNIVRNMKTGRTLGRIDARWNTARERSGLGDHITPHILRHTRATWLMQAAVPEFEAAGSLGMSAQTLARVYGHHSPNWQKKASEIG